MGIEVEDASVKETRRILRQVQIHLTQSSIHLGAVREPVGLVDVIYHSVSKLPTLNYVTPRRSTAWISGKDIEQGLGDLRSRARLPRVEYIEGLFPPLFSKTLLDLGLIIERETPLMVLQKEINKLAYVPTPDGVAFDLVSDQRGSALWWYIWRNAYYDVITHTADPVFIGDDLRQVAGGSQVDVIMYRYRFPVGAARVTLLKDNDSAQITALAVMRQWRSPEFERSLQIQAVKVALERGSTLIFTSGISEHDRKLCRDNGFVDCGSVVCYAETNTETQTLKDTEQDVTVAQPLLTGS